MIEHSALDHPEPYAKLASWVVDIWVRLGGGEGKSTPPFALLQCDSVQRNNDHPLPLHHPSLFKSHV